MDINLNRKKIRFQRKNEIFMMKVHNNMISSHKLILACMPAAYTEKSIRIGKLYSQRIQAIQL